MNTQENKTCHHGQISLFDPTIGFIYSTELFEKDLYRDKHIQAKNDEIPTDIGASKTKQIRHPRP